MKILVCAAMPQELKFIKTGIKKANLKTKLNIDYLCTGIGNYETISSLESYISTHEEEIFIFNIGVCGYRNPEGKELKSPIQLASVTNIYTEKESIVPVFTQIENLRHGFSSENIVYKKPELGKEINPVNNEWYFDMESRGIEFIAMKHKLPRILLKVPLDFVGEETKRIVKTKAVQELGNRLENLDYHRYLTKILEWIKIQN